ncbi:MAG: alkaline shock response membrane anchor protein AmaP [Clostridiales bacterium]|nr:alkaline shock response membrane anchor protein AmaP [Clostridiales bacterium]
MKLKIGDRILLIILVLILMLFSLGLLAMVIGIIPASNVGSIISEANRGMSAIVTVTIAVILFIVGLRLLVASLIPPKQLSTILAITELGVVRVSVATLDTLTQKAVHSFQEVKEVKSVVLPDADGARIQLKITILPDVVMPELTQSIQTKVKEYVESLSGINVKEVQVYIENLSIAKPVRVE